MASIDDYLNEGSLPEAPASVTYNLTTPNGFDVLFTLRALSDVELIELMGSIEGHFLNEGYSPKGRGGKPTRRQPSKSKYNSGGTKSYGNSNSYKKQSSGQPWENDPATPKQRDVLMDWGMWRDGMSKQEASDKISAKLGK